MNRVDGLLEMAKRDLARQGYIQPVVLIQAGGRLTAYPMTWEDEQQKAVFFEMINRKARELGADAVSVITEAWVRDKDKESDVSRPADAIYAIDISPVGNVEVGAVRVVATAQGLGFERMEPDPSVKERASLFSPWRTAQ